MSCLELNWNCLEYCDDTLELNQNEPKCIKIYRQMSYFLGVSCWTCSMDHSLDRQDSRCSRWWWRWGGGWRLWWPDQWWWSQCPGQGLLQCQLSSSIYDRVDHSSGYQSCSHCGLDRRSQCSRDQEHQHTRDNTLNQSNLEILIMMKYFCIPNRITM